MFSRTTRLAAAGFVAFATLGVTGCSAERSADAARIRAAVHTMPGVDTADVDYVNDFENGANLDIRLDMTHATTDQIRTAVEGIDELEGSDFEDHRQTTRITVAESAEVEYGGYGTCLDAVHISTDAGAIRGLRARTTAASIRWQHFDDYSSLDLWASTNPDSDLRATVAALPNDSTHVYVRSDAPERRSSWDVALPITLKQMDDAVGIRDRLPVLVYQVDMRDGRIGGLSANLAGSATALSHLVAVVSAVAPTQSHPLSVEWRLAAAAPHEVGRFTACTPEVAASTVAPPNPNFTSLNEWAAQAFPGCSS